jgi:hypothetical protein
MTARMGLGYEQPARAILPRRFTSAGPKARPVDRQAALAAAYGVILAALRRRKTCV